MNSTILHDAEIGDGCVIAANSLAGQGARGPHKSFVTGVPGEIKGEASPRQLWWTQNNPDVYSKLAKQYKAQGF
jgi:carbonic anhydrase/acetyltransferase-like protein (isoleucine patch superfamily)